MKPYNSPDEVPDNDYTPPSPDAELPDYDPLSPVAELLDAPVAELLDAQSTAPMSPDKHFTLLPPHEGEERDEDEPSFLSTTVPILPPPLPSLQVVQDGHLPFQPTAPLASSTPDTSMSSPPQRLHSQRKRIMEESKTDIPNKQRRTIADSREQNGVVRGMMFKRRQKKVKQTTAERKQVITVEDHLPTRKAPKVRYWIPELGLHDRDREILLSTEWLNDRIIDATQQLLKQACPALSGLQQVCHGLTMNYEIEPAEFVQIVHNGHGHWLTIATIGTSHPDVRVYDSMYPSAGTHVKAQIAALLHTTSPEIRLHFMDVQMQAGGSDCGLFAIAFATALALGKQPGQYRFDQTKMRQHLCKCLESRKIKLFPYTKQRRATESSIKNIETVRVYCVCRMPELPGTQWVECSRCKEWYHTDTCVPASQDINHKANWYCMNCN